ncbi:MAG TPA: hypothetical protein VN822_13055 [Candidatus Acidoferrales bacterium]|nr:hypothetical protein [Candidatus Acidoferrales bacterium]
MKTQSTSGWLRFGLRVNGLEFHEASLRASDEHPTNFEIVIRDRQLGGFPLHEEFLLEVMEAQEDKARWRRVSLTELKDVIWREARMTDSELDWRTGPGSSPSDDPQGQSRRRIERIPVEGDASHIDRLHAALMQAQIRYQIVGGLDSRGRSWGHLTLVVCSLLGAGMCLRRAGFLESQESKYVVVDSRTGWKLRLLEGRPGRSR